MQSFASRVRCERLASTLAAVLALSALTTGCVQPRQQQSIASTVSPIAVSTSAGAPTRIAGQLDLEGRSSRHTITRSELESVSVATAFDLVVRLRPEFLRRSARRPGIGTHNEPVVYVDAVQSGPLSALGMIPASHVMDITYVTPVDALLRFGPTHGAGAIVVRTRR